MKIHQTLTSVFILITTVLCAQTKPQDRLELTTGISVPTGKFSQTSTGTFDHWNNQAGFAKTGYILGIAGAHYLTRHFAIGGTLYYSDHGGLNRKDAQNLSASYTDAFAVDESTVSTSGTYRAINLLLGPTYSFSLRRFTIGAHGFAGVVKSISTPQITVQLEDQTAATFSQQNSKSSAFGWQLGAEAQYNLTSKLSFIAKVDYFSSPGIAIENKNRTNNAGRLVTMQPMAWLNVSAGLAYCVKW